MYASLGHYNDMDMLQVGRGMSYEEDKTDFTMWCIMHSPLLLGNDLNTISNETMEIIKNKDLIDINQSSFVYQARRIVDLGDLEIWAKPLISSISGEVVVTLLNRSKTAQDITVKVNDIGLEAAKGYTEKDLWTKDTFSTSFKESITKEVPSHGVVVLTLKGTSMPFNVFQFKDKK